MRYLIASANQRVMRRRTFQNDPREIEGVTIPNNATVHEIEDSVADGYDATLEALETGEHATFDGTTLVTVRAVDAFATAPFKRQLGAVIQPLKVNQRRVIIDIIGPAFAMDDPEAMISALTAFDASGLPPRIRSLKSDLLTVIGREVTKRSGL